MAMTCARCGAQNPDTNLYCQNCGNPLTAPAAAPAPSAAPPGPPPGPPPGAAPPGFASPPAYASPPGYASPYYAPVAPTPPVHRTPWMVIVAAVVALVVIAAGFGTAIAVLGNRNASTNGGSGIADVASPSPETTPSPVGSPVPTPTAGTQSNDGLSVTLPSGWTIADRDSETLVLSDPDNEGEVTLASGASSPAQTAQDNKNTIDSGLKSKYPDTRSCPGTTTTNGTFNGAKGISWTLCLTLTNGTQSVPAAASIFAGANSTGSVYYVVIVLARQDDLAHYVSVTKPLLATVHWKLA